MQIINLRNNINAHLTYFIYTLFDQSSFQFSPHNWPIQSTNTQINSCLNPIDLTRDAYNIDFTKYTIVTESPPHPTPQKRVVYLKNFRYNINCDLFGILS